MMISLRQRRKHQPITARTRAERDECRPWQNFGFGLAYLYNDADATLNNVGNDKGVDVKWNYAGPFAYLTLGFGEVNK